MTTKIINQELVLSSSNKTAGGYKIRYLQSLENLLKVIQCYNPKQIYAGLLNTSNTINYLTSLCGLWLQHSGFNNLNPLPLDLTFKKLHNFILIIIIVQSH